MSRNRLRHRVEIAVRKLNDVIARPVVGDPCEITQIADHDSGTYRRPASAPGDAGQDELIRASENLGRSCPRSALSCAHQPLLGQLRLFGGVCCYRQSLHTDGIEMQKLGKTICDVPTAKSI